MQTLFIKNQKNILLNSAIEKNIKKILYKNLDSKETSPRTNSNIPKEKEGLSVLDEKQRKLEKLEEYLNELQKQTEEVRKEIQDTKNELSNFIKEQDINNRKEAIEEIIKTDKCFYNYNKSEQDYIVEKYFQKNNLKSKTTEIKKEEIENEISTTLDVTENKVDVLDVAEQTLESDLSEDSKYFNLTKGLLNNKEFKDVIGKLVYSDYKDFFEKNTEEQLELINNRLKDKSKEQKTNYDTFEISKNILEFLQKDRQKENNEQLLSSLKTKTSNKEALNKLHNNYKAIFKSIALGCFIAISSTLALPIITTGKVTDRDKRYSGKDNTEIVNNNSNIVTPYIEEIDFNSITPYTNPEYFSEIKEDENIVDSFYKSIAIYYGEVGNMVAHSLIGGEKVDGLLKNNLNDFIYKDNYGNEFINLKKIEAYIQENENEFLSVYNNVKEHDEWFANSPIVEAVNEFSLSTTDKVLNDESSTVDVIEEDNTEDGVLDIEETDIEQPVEETVEEVVNIAGINVTEKVNSLDSQLDSQIEIKPAPVKASNTTTTANNIMEPAKESVVLSSKIVEFNAKSQDSITLGDVLSLGRRIEEDQIKEIPFFKNISGVEIKDFSSQKVGVMVRINCHINKNGVIYPIEISGSEKLNFLELFRDNIEERESVVDDVVKKYKQ